MYADIIMDVIIAVLLIVIACSVLYIIYVLGRNSTDNSGDDGVDPHTVGDNYLDWNN